ncbi:MAG: aspartate aminotransferase family protein [Proteobacteria bacterium]|nr:aspartate aminotransferase family protein [Pseudomonadota bacterium]
MSASWPARADAVLMATYRRAPIVFVRGEGSWLYDEAGKAYLDCLGGVAVCSVGHANPRVARAISDQLGTLVHVSNLFYTVPQVELAERLVARSGLDRVFFANCGATANETAIKLARRWGQQGAQRRHGVISLLGSFHGRTLATLAATGQPEKQAVFEPLPPGFSQVPPEDLDALAAAIEPTTVAVMIETLQGEGGVRPLGPAYLEGLRRLCDERGLLLIVDDVQAGMGRCGRWFSWQDLGLMPDIATTAKALGGGLPIGACLAREGVAAAFRPGDHATTFGGGPAVCRGALAVLDEIDERDLLANCVARGAELRAALERVPGVCAVRGRGLLLGAVLERPCAEALVARALELGLVVNNVRPEVVRFAPPLSITTGEVGEAAERFARALVAVAT